MKFFVLLIFLVTALFSTSPISAATPISKPLRAQVQNLVKLLSDGSAVGNPKSTLVQNVKIDTYKNITLTAFTLEGFGGGNNWSQYLAIFSQETTLLEGKTYYMLIDVIPIGSGGWRMIEALDARVTTANKDETTFVIDTLENVGDDPPNYPSKKSTVKLLLKSGRISEQHPFGWVH